MSSGADRLVPAALVAFASTGAVAVGTPPFTVDVCVGGGACAPAVALPLDGCVFVVFVAGAGADVGAGAGAGF